MEDQVWRVMNDLEWLKWVLVFFVSWANFPPYWKAIAL